MKRLTEAITGFVRDDSGQDLIEYALLAALIALACVAGMGLVKDGINTLFGNVKTRLDAAGGS